MIRRPRYDKNHQRGEGASLSRERGGRKYEDRRTLGQHNIRNPGHEQVAIRCLVARRSDSEQNGADREAWQGPRYSTDTGSCEYIPVERLDDEVLRKYGIRSYLITPSLPETPMPSPMRCVFLSGVGKSQIRI